MENLSRKMEDLLKINNDKDNSITKNELKKLLNIFELDPYLENDKDYYSYEEGYKILESKIKKNNTQVNKKEFLSECKNLMKENYEFIEKNFSLNNKTKYIEINNLEEIIKKINNI